MAERTISLSMRVRSMPCLYAAYFLRRPRFLHGWLVRRGIEMTKEG